ncbi:ribonuclease D [Novipirellula artificiosorum]|uniref:Ribonuclease D n=1 Tax=Novipirellula artificiosorum TaxID=2528016 RepID=A0A5C6DX54_9BACT|nr:HRDC domain-containing protein [Novipirellula artificiosorum]TWU42013.1 Ribonuclease D [Novipirellula artificiosorum]
MHYDSITNRSDLDQLCEQIAASSIVGFDTEFVSEDSYRPELCLVQVALPGRLAIIDPYRVDSTEPFWDVLSQPGRIVIAHAAREEIRFCYRFSGKPIAGLFDTQLAAGFVGMEYPASLATLVQRLAGRSLPKGETRTNWRHRPLSKDQLTYAAHDVVDLETMYNKLAAMVNTLQRETWVEEETANLQQKVIDAETRENWRRVSGSAGLNARQLEIVRQLWLWREGRARETDRIPRRVMRDDLMIELAKRGSPNIEKIRGIRGLERRGYSGHYEAIAQAIQVALETPEDQLPRRARGNRKSVSPMLSQFLSTSIACISRQHKLAPPIVGNADDVRELLGYELESRKSDSLPALLEGWRGDIVGKPFRKLLSGELAIRVADVEETQPLEFIEVD